MGLFDTKTATNFTLGVNYWPRRQATYMWRDWAPEEIVTELAQMISLGMNTIRAFVYMPDFMPTSALVEPVMLERLVKFLDICQEGGMAVFLTPLVGHMSGENWEVRWRAGRDFFRDEEFVKDIADFIGVIARTTKDHPALSAWIISNELPLYAGHTDNISGVRWVDQMIKAIRQSDPSRPIGLGDGAWNALGEQNGLPIEQLASRLDFLGPHTYPWDEDALRHSYTPAFLVRVLHAFHKNIVLEEFGCSTTHASEEHQADYYRTTMHSCFVGGARGIISWCFSDFNLPYQRPYAHHSFELDFGVTRDDGSLKPAAEEFKYFASTVSTLQAEPVKEAKINARIIFPSFVHTKYPWPWWKSSEDIWRPMLEGMILARQARLEIGFWAEPSIPSDGFDRPEPITQPQIPADTALLIVPSSPALTGPTWEALASWVRAGGTLYVSFRQGMWIHNFEELFGCKHQLRFGLATIPPSNIEWRWSEDFGGIASGEVWTYQPKGEERRDTGICPVELTTATVLAHDQDGRPALLLHKLGAGQVVFSTYPLEYYLSNIPDAHETDRSDRLYRALARLAGIDSPIKTEHPGLEITLFQRENDAFLWVINHSWEPVQQTIEVDIPFIRVRSLPSQSVCDLNLTLKAKEVRVLKLER